MLKCVASIPAVSLGSTAAMPNISLLEQEELLAQPLMPIKGMNSKDLTCPTSCKHLQVLQKLAKQATGSRIFDRRISCF